MDGDGECLNIWEICGAGGALERRGGVGNYKALRGTGSHFLATESLKTLIRLSTPNFDPVPLSTENNSKQKMVLSTSSLAKLRKLVSKKHESAWASWPTISTSAFCSACETNNEMTLSLHSSLEIGDDGKDRGKAFE